MRESKDVCRSKEVSDDSSLSESWLTTSLENWGYIQGGYTVSGQESRTEIGVSFVKTCSFVSDLDWLAPISSQIGSKSKSGLRVN